MTLLGKMILMTDFEFETNKIENWQSEQKWAVRDPFTHVTDFSLFVGFDSILKSLYQFAGLGKNYAAIYGQYGFGKTSVLKKIAHEFSKKYNVLMFEDVPEKEYVAEKIKNLCSGRILRKLKLTKIDDHDYTSLNKRIGKHTILIFDEAHSINEKVFSYIRSLSENGTTFSVIFAGKPELMRGKLPRYLLDRMELSEPLRPFTESESLDLIKKRVEILAKSTDYLFSEEAMKLIAKKSAYIPREILENCSKFVSFALENNLHKIEEDDVKKNYTAVAREAGVPEYMPEEKFRTAPPETTAFEAEQTTEADEPEEEKLSTFEKMIEGTKPIYVPHSHSVDKQTLINELSPLQKQILLYLFEKEPQTAPEIADGLHNDYNTVRHMLKRLMGLYGEKEAKAKISNLFPLIEKEKNQYGRGNVFKITIHARKVLSED